MTLVVTEICIKCKYTGCVEGLGCNAQWLLACAQSRLHRERTVALYRVLRLPGDLVFIVFGAVPLMIASGKAYLRLRAAAKDMSDAAA